jgi:hypothetical protein
MRRDIGLVARVVLLVCIVNGIPRLLPWPEAHAKLWALNIGWVVPANWFRYRLGRKRKAFFLDDLDEVGGAEMEFLYPLIIARYQPIIEDDIPGEDPEITGIPRQSFVQRRHRSSIFPPGCDPIEVVPTLRAGRAVNGYLIRRGVTSIMILRVHGGGYFPWAVLLEPPNPRGGLSALDVADLLRGSREQRLLPPPKPGD